MIIDDLLKQWNMNKIEPSNLSDATKEKYVKYGEVILRYFNGMDTEDIKPSFYQEQFNVLAQGAGKDYVQRVDNIVKRMIAFAQADGLSVRDFTVGFEIFSKRPKKLREDKYLHSVEDYELVLKECKSKFVNYDSSVRAYYIYLLFQTGLRPSELLGQRWKDINLVSGTLTTRDRVDTNKIIRCPPKNHSSIRTIPLNTETIEVFKELKEKQKIMLKEHNMLNPEGLVFLHWSYKKLLPHHATLNQFLRSILDELYISPRISLYGARHTRISVLIANGVDLDVIAKYVGHTSTEQIIKTYGGLLKEKEVEGFEQIKGI